MLKKKELITQLLEALKGMTSALTWSRSLTLSMGATAVLEMAAAIPPAKKSLAKEIAVSVIFCCGRSSVGFACGVEVADSKREERAFKKTERHSTRELRLLRLIGWPRQQWAGRVDVL